MSQQGPPPAFSIQELGTLLAGVLMEDGSSGGGCSSTTSRTEMLRDTGNLAAAKLLATAILATEQPSAPAAPPVTPGRVGSGMHVDGSTSMSATGSNWSIIDAATFAQTLAQAIIATESGGSSAHTGGGSGAPMSSSSLPTSSMPAGGVNGDTGPSFSMREVATNLARAYLEAGDGGGGGCSCTSTGSVGVAQAPAFAENSPAAGASHQSRLLETLREAHAQVERAAQQERAGGG